MAAITVFDSADQGTAAAIASVGTPFYGIGGETYMVITPGFKSMYNRGGVMSVANYRFAEEKLGREYLLRTRSIPELLELSLEIEALSVANPDGLPSVATQIQNPLRE